MNQNDMQKKSKIAFISSNTSAFSVNMLNHIKKLSTQFDIYIYVNLSDKKEKKGLKIKQDITSLNELKKNAKINNIFISRRIMIYYDIKALILLYIEFKKNEYNAIHSFTSKVGMLALIAGYLARVKIRLHTFTGQVWYTKKGLLHFFYKNCDKLIASLATNCYADSKTQMEFLVKSNVVDNGKISVLGNGSISGVDLKKFKKNYKTRIILRKKLSIPNDYIVFIMICRMNKDKGVLDLAIAFSKLIQSNNSCLIFVGPDEDNIIPQVKSIIGSNHDSIILFFDYSFEVEKYLQLSDILCLPSYREGFGSVIIEAAAVGLTSIGSNIYGIRDAIVNGKTGLLHEPGNVEEIYNCMKNLLVNEKLRENLSYEAKLRVYKNFSQETITKAWLKEYNNLFTI